MAPIEKIRGRRALLGARATRCFLPWYDHIAEMLRWVHSKVGFQQDSPTESSWFWVVELASSPVCVQQEVVNAASFEGLEKSPACLASFLPGLCS